MNKWEQRNRPSRLERRFEFDTYDETRTFLEKLGDLSEAVKIYPDISFGKTYANVTIRTEDDEMNSSITSIELDFAKKIDEM
tara:strand:- start:2865 stop:3110 length:246 start_codon:yes stop_codon:yes gene_type:complete